MLVWNPPSLNCGCVILHHIERRILGEGMILHDNAPLQMVRYVFIRCWNRMPSNVSHFYHAPLSTSRINGLARFLEVHLTVSADRLKTKEMKQCGKSSLLQIAYMPEQWPMWYFSNTWLYHLKQLPESEKLFFIRSEFNSDEGHTDTYQKICCSRRGL